MPANESPRKPSTAGKPAARPAAGARASSGPPRGGATAQRPSARGNSARSSSAGSSSARSSSARSSSAAKPGRSIVSKPQRPWGVIVTSIVVALFAIGVLLFAITRHKTTKPDASNLYIRPEIASAKAITGLAYTPIAAHQHVVNAVKYSQSPPIGGDHSAVWADCSGVVYPNAIANENGVHTLEHGAVWITYRPGLPAAQVATLSALVTGQNYTLMSPYPGLKTAISLQAWDYQLFVDSASDPRIKEFIATLRNNKGTTPEYPGNCSNPSFKKNPSTPGHPIYP